MSKKERTKLAGGERDPRILLRSVQVERRASRRPWAAVQLLIQLLLWVILTGVALAQGETAVEAFTLPVGARANAMGGALTAVAGDPFAAYYNPAAIGAGSYGTFAFFRAEW